MYYKNNQSTSNILQTPMVKDQIKFDLHYSSKGK